MRAFGSLCLTSWTCFFSRSPSSAFLPFLFGGRVPLKKTTEESWYPSNLSTGEPGSLFLPGLETFFGVWPILALRKKLSGAFFGRSTQEVSFRVPWTLRL